MIAMISAQITYKAHKAMEMSPKKLSALALTDS